MLLSDHHQTEERLAALAAQLVDGASAEQLLDPEALARIEEDLALRPEQLELPLGCRVAVWIPIVLLFALAILVGILRYAGAYSKS
jgi:hypothetical protein